jgi:hypothetical protein
LGRVSVWPSISLHGVLIKLSTLAGLVLDAIDACRCIRREVSEEVCRIVMIADNVNGDVDAKWS